MNLYVLEINHKNGWKNLVRFKSRTFHDLSQMSKRSGMCFSCDSNHLITMIRLKEAHDSNQVQSLIRVNLDRVK